MRVLVVGGGGREHALAWGLKNSPSVREVLAAPGNAGIAEVARCLPAKIDDIDGIVALVRAEKPSLVVVGPEAPLVAGLADRLRADGVCVFGPSALASEIEGSKAWTKAFMHRHGIPTAAFAICADGGAVDTFLDGKHGGFAVKADGLAAGKGVVLCADPDEARVEAKRMLGGSLGAAGARVVIEEMLVGREASLLALVDGENVTVLPAAEDHKTVFDGDRGPMTGGMGTVSPTPVLGDAEVARAVDEVLRPTAAALVAEHRPFHGVLFAGLMMTAQGPRVLEFNCRFGDPETQVIVPRIDEDLGALLHAAANHEQPARVRVKSGAAVCVVMTAPGYPGSYPSGAAIDGLDAAGDALVFHAGTRTDGERVVTAGGRVLGVVGRGADVDGARAVAYAAVERIRFDGAHYRKDIGRR
jgi:phosphoribosylamine--glycine ligase